MTESFDTAAWAAYSGWSVEGRFRALRYSAFGGYSGIRRSGV